MEKEFFDVFPNLKLKQELSELLEEVIVTKVACNSAKTCVRVYLKSDRWIHKKHIFSLEEQIQRQCFPGLEVSVKVIEKFHLSRQYTPKNFLDTYRSSMELELRNYNMLEYNLFKQAQITFPEDDCLNMALPDSVISRQKSEILIEYLHKVFCERCGMDLKVSLDYVQTEESRYRKNAAIQIRQEVANVLKHARLSTEEESVAPASAAEEKQEKRQQPARQPLPDRRRKQRQPVKRSLSRKSHSKRKANGVISVVASARIQIRMLFMEEISRTSLFHWKILCRKWERLSSAARLWMWKRERFEMRRPY